MNLVYVYTTIENVLTETAGTPKKINHTTCATIIAPALHGKCENRVRFKRRVAANTNSIAAAPLGTIDIGTCGNKCNSYFRLSLSPALRIVADKDRNRHRATWKRGNKSQSPFCRL